jgi:hypothetical protein
MNPDINPAETRQDNTAELHRIREMLIAAIPFVRMAAWRSAWPDERTLIQSWLKDVDKEIGGDK